MIFRRRDKYGGTQGNRFRVNFKPPYIVDIDSTMVPDTISEATPGQKTYRHRNVEKKLKLGGISYKDHFETSESVST